MVVGQAVGSVDVAIVGGGPGGYVAAIRLAELGRKVTVIDKESVGGVCLHHGCIPTKALIHAADIYRDSKASSELGITVSGVSLDFKKTQEWKRNIVSGLDQGVRSLFKHHGISLIKAHASFESSEKLNLQPLGEEHLELNGLEFKKCIIAVGSKEKMLPGVAVDGQNILTSTHAIEMDRIPESVLVIGGGYIGIELSQMLAKFGCKVTIVEFLPRIITLIDGEMSEIVKKNLAEMGSVVHLNTKVESCRVENGRVLTTVVHQDGNRETFNTEKAIVAVGRVPLLDNLQLDNTKVKLDAHGFIQVTQKMETTDPRIFAIGDVVGGAMLAHKASYEGKIAAEVIAGKDAKYEALIPYAIFSEPEIAGVGLTEEVAKQKNIPYTVKKFPLSASGKARILGSAKGFFKVLYDKEKHILGLHIVGARASDMIGEAVLAMGLGATLDDMAKIVHPHPTLVESYGELADLGIGFPTNSL